jgi:hypothetical protein
MDFKFLKKANRIVDSIKDSMGIFTNLLLEETMNVAKKPLDKIQKNLNKPLSDARNQSKKIIINLEKAFISLWRNIKIMMKKLLEILEFIFEGMKNSIMDPMEGIEDMIENFNRFVCALKTIPSRVEYLLTGFDNIFQGSMEQITRIEDSYAKSGKESDKLFTYSFYLLKSYMECAGRFIVQIPNCAFYYIVSFVLHIFYLPIRLTIWSLNTFLSIDLRNYEKELFATVDTIDGYIYSLFNFHINQFPSDVQKKCFTCIRFREDVVANQGRKMKRKEGFLDLDYFFKKNRKNNEPKKQKKKSEIEVEETTQESVKKMLDGEQDKEGLYKVKLANCYINEAINSFPRPRNINEIGRI